MSKIKILHIIRQADIGGGERHLQLLVKNLNKEKYESVILSFSKGLIFDELKSLGFECFHLHSKKTFDINVIKFIYKLLRSKKINLIHAHGSRAGINSILPSIKLNIPIVYTVHGWSFHPGISKISYYIRKWIEKLICYQAKAIINVSLTDSLVFNGKFNDKTRIVYNGVDFENFFVISNKQQLRKEFGYSEEDFVLGFFSRLTQQKNPIKLLQAFQLLNNENKKFKLLIAGDGELKNQVQEFIKRNNLEDSIKIFGFRSDVNKLLNVIDVYLLPSFWEGLSIGLLEAMAVGIPAVVSSIKNNKEIIFDKENGLLIDPNDADQIYEAVKLLSSNRDLYNKISYNALKFVKEKFDKNRMVTETEDIYSLIINKPGSKIG
ncbi:MAG: glycosyltransferase family 4 protein [Ignavibacteria bacterium]|nr:glycosyltransferase family 4 protein [Ignavibacteria bacterium]